MRQRSWLPFGEAGRLVSPTLTAHPVDRPLQRKYSRGSARLLLGVPRAEIQSAVCRFSLVPRELLGTAPQVLEELSNSSHRVAPQRD